MIACRGLDPTGVIAPWRVGHVWIHHWHEILGCMWHLRDWASIRGISHRVKSVKGVLRALLNCLGEVRSPSFCGEALRGIPLINYSLSSLETRRRRYRMRTTVVLRIYHCLIHMYSCTTCECIRQAVLCITPSKVRPLVRSWAIRALVVCFEWFAPYLIFCVLIVCLGLCEILLLYFLVDIIALVDLRKVRRLPFCVTSPWLVWLTNCNRHLKSPSVNNLSIIMIDSPLCTQMVFKPDS